MKRRAPDPVRIADLPPEHDLSRLAVLVESASQAPAWDLPLVQWRIRSTLRRRMEWRRRALRVALVGVLMFIAGGVVGAVVQPLLISRLHLQAQPSIEPARPLARGTGRRASLPRFAPSDAESESTPASGEAAKSLTAAEPAVAVAPQASAEPLSAANRVAWQATAKTARPGQSVAAPNVPPSAPTPVATVAAPKASPTTAAPFEASAILLGIPPAATPIPPVMAGTPVLGRSAAVAGTPVVAGTSIVAGTPVGTPQIALNTPPPPPLSEAQIPPSGNARTSPVPPVTASSQPAASRRPTEPLTVNAPVAVLPDEQALLTKALRRLRVERDPESALAVLDEHRARFPGGVLAPEAARLRVEALWLTGRREAALAELDRDGSDVLPDRDERCVFRGELHARAGQWRLALTDFEAVLRSHPPDQVGADGTPARRLRECIERALWGRASARSHSGDAAGARADLREYLQRFPRGHFAAEAARLAGPRR